VPEADLLAAGVEPWLHLPLWLPAELARTAWDVDTTGRGSSGLPGRPLAGPSPTPGPGCRASTSSRPRRTACPGRGCRPSWRLRCWPAAERPEAPPRDPP
jgi:hypothetical protein